MNRQVQIRPTSICGIKTAVEGMALSINLFRSLSTNQNHNEGIKRMAETPKGKLNATRLYILLALFHFVVASAACSANALPTTLMRFPNVGPDRIVFEANGSLWTVARTGGAATRLTQTSGQDIMPRYSPDGKWIAYTGIHAGVANVYVVPAEGGQPRQLTVFSKPGRTRGFRDNLVLTWTPDGTSVVFLSRRMSWNGWLERPFTVGLEGGLPVPLPIERAGALTYGPGGKSIAVESVLRDFEPRKHYNGGQTQQISIFDLGTHAVRKIAATDAVNSSPMWVGREIYFRSDRDPHRRANLWVADLDTNKVHELTHFTDYDIDFPSYGSGAISFQQGGKLWSFDLASKRLLAVDVAVPDTNMQAEPRTVSVGDQIRPDIVPQSSSSVQHPDYAISPDGAAAAFSARGDLYLVSVGGDSGRNLTNTSSADEDHPAFSPDGRFLAYTTDRNGEEQLAVRSLDGGSERLLTHFHSGYLYTPVWSPDGRSIAIPDVQHRLWLVSLDGGEPSCVATDPQTEIHDASFAPDARWLVFSTQRSNGLSAIHLYEIATKRDTIISNPMNDDFHPIFSAEGGYLFFISRRHELEAPSESQRVFARVKSDGVYAASLNRHLPSPFDHSQQVAPRVSDTNTPAHLLRVSVDFDGLMDRVAALPMPASDITSLELRGNKIFYRTRPVATLEGVLPGETSALHAFDLGTLQTTTLVEGLASSEIAADGNHVLYDTDEGTWHSLNLAAQPRRDTLLDTKALQSTVDPRQEWGEMFERAWRLDRDVFFDPGMDGVNWQRVHDAYAKFLPLLGTRDDLNYVISEMQGELASSHMVVSGGDTGDTSAPAPAPVLLGVDFELDRASSRYRFGRIYRGDNSRPSERSPLTAPGLEVKEGDYLLAVNGTELLAPTNPYLPFIGLRDTVTLTISRTAHGPGRTINVQPLRSEQALRQADWIRRERESVDALSGGKLAYVFLPDMGEDGAEQFTRQYFPQLDKAGLIIDMRFNRGGYLSPFLLEMLNRRITGRFINREGGGEFRPRELMTGPKVCLINEFTSSDGEQFAYFFNQAAVGQLVGKRTAGSVRGISGSWDLLDGGSITFPINALYADSGKPLIEGGGVAPGVEVDNSSMGSFGTHDRQLNAAIKLALRQLERSSSPLVGK